jgi:hypothetical protein
MSQISKTSPGLYFLCVKPGKEQRNAGAGVERDNNQGVEAATASGPVGTRDIRINKRKRGGPENWLISQYSGLTPTAIEAPAAVQNPKLSLAGETTMR